MRRIANHTIQGLVVAMVLGLCAAPAAHADVCSVATLRGNYGGLLTGTVIGLGPIALVVSVTFDGQGGWSFDKSGSVNGSVQPIEHVSGGTYLVKTNCTGSTRDSNNSTDFVIVGSGNDIEIMLAGTTPGQVYTVVLKKRFSSGSND